MFASFDYQLSKEEHARGLQVVMTLLLAEDRRSTWRCVQWLAMIAFAVGIASVTYPGSFDAILLALMLIMIGNWLLNTRQVREWHKLSHDPLTATSKVIFDKSGVVRQRNNDEHRWSWNALRRIHVLPELVVLEFTGWDHITLPDRLWTGLDQRSGFIKQLREKASNLLPDFPADRLRPTTGFSFLRVGAVAAAIDIFILLNVLAVLLLARRTFDYDLRSVVWATGLATAVFLAIAISAGFVIDVRLGRLGKHRPRLAASVAASFILAASAVVIAYFVIRAN